MFIIKYLIQKISRPLINDHYTLMFLLHVSTSLKVITMAVYTKA